MASAAQFGATVIGVTDKLPIDATLIGEDTVPLSTTQIEGYLEEAASKITNTISLQGVVGRDDPTLSLPDSTKAELAALILDYAVAESLLKLRRTGEDYRARRERWEEGLRRLREQPSPTLGAVPSVKHNLPPGARQRTRRFGGIGWAP